MNEGTSARRTQRLGAYGIALRNEGAELLLTRISARGFPVGAWGLPGGGVDHGESPDDAVRREMYEETGLDLLDQRLVDVHHVHTVASGRDDAWEDYHGVHLLYEVRVDPRQQPRVVEVDGTTDVVSWVRLSQVRDGTRVLLPVVEYVLDRLGVTQAGGV